MYLKPAKQGPADRGRCESALKEVKMALLEADVNFKVVKQFVKSVQERAIGADVMNGLNPGQMVIKIVNEEMIKMMGSETTELKLRPGQATTIIMMVGLQGAGKRQRLQNLQEIQTQRKETTSGCLRRLSSGCDPAVTG